MTRAAFPGTFDPITLGHESLARRAARVLDEVLVCVAAGIHKRAFFSLEERVEMARESFCGEANIRILAFDGLLVSALRREDCRIILRGMRAVSDFEFESQMSQVNKALAPDVETLVFPPERAHIHLSSTMAREVAQLGGDVEKFVSRHVAERLRAKMAAAGAAATAGSGGGGGVGAEG